MHYCSQCGHEISRQEKFCRQCNTRVEYLCALPPVPPNSDKRREIRSAPSITKWIVGYFALTAMIFMTSFYFYSAPGFQFWPFAEKKPVPAAPVQHASAAARTESPTTTLKSSYNQLLVGVQKAVSLIEDSRKVNVPGDQKRTAINYRAVQRNSDALLAQLTMPPDVSPEVSVVVASLKECVTLIGKSTSIMADYLDGKLSLSPPNPDWVGRSQEFSAQAQARLREAQQGLLDLRKKIE